MKARDIKELLHILETMAEAEMVMAELYKACAETWKQDSEFWSDLSREEIQHAQNVKKLSDIILKKMDSEASFKHHRPFTLNSIQSFIASVVDTMENVKQGKTSYVKILATAFDIERSLLECKYAELVKTHDIEYQTLAAIIDEETKIHRDKIETKLKGCKTTFHKK